MERAVLDKYITDTYGAVGEYMWEKYPTFAVYRHQNNKKWFAVIMEIPKSKLDICGDDSVCIINLKCDPTLIGSLLLENGIHKGYHMNKNYWITVRLDGSVYSDKIKWLLDLSFDLTSTEKNRGRK